jgi:hypothetical protein
VSKPSEPGPPGPPDDVPVFARSFPSDAGLSALVTAFKEGDYAKVRRDAPALAKSTDSDDVRKAARELVSRTDADPLMKGLLVVTGLLLAVLMAYWELRK